MLFELLIGFSTAEVGMGKGFSQQWVWIPWEHSKLLQGFFEGEGRGNGNFCHFSVEAEQKDAFRRPRSVVN